MPFNIIRIPGQGNLVSDQSDDVLDIVAGPGIELTTNAAIDTITITATGGGSSGSGYTGSAGPSGVPGALGYTGSEGLLGYTGSKGNTGGLGDIGYTGSKGDTGLGFAIAKSYSSVAALQADPAPTGIVPGQFAIVETGNVNDPENSRLYLWTGTVYSYVSDLSGNIGITGPQGITGYTGSLGSLGYTGSASTIIGFTGSQGATGSQGDTGFTGSASTIIGFTGSQGATGNVGFTGSAAFNYAQDTGEPTGFPDRTDSTIAFNNATREFSIAPVSGSYDIYTVGVKRTISTTNTITIPNVTDLYYIYFDSAGVLQYKNTFYDWPVDCMVAYVYWNATVGSSPFVADERHGITMDWATHEYLHRTRGAAIASGFEVTNYTITGTGNANMDAQLDIANGTFFDEDLEVFISHSLTPAVNEFQQHLQGAARIPMMYLNVADWVMDVPTAFPLKQGTTLPKFNEFAGSSWVTTDIDNNKYGITYIIATNNITYPVIGIIGQTSYNTLSTAQDATFDSLDLTGFPVVEFRPLYKVIYEVKNTYTNAVKAKFVAVQDLRSISAVSAISAAPGGLGYTGSAGTLGFTGSTGFTGSGGLGFTGSQGNIGFTGSQVTGFTGSVGTLIYQPGTAVPFILRKTNSTQFSVASNATVLANLNTIISGNIELSNGTNGFTIPRTGLYNIDVLYLYADPTQESTTEVHVRVFVNGVQSYIFLEHAPTFGFNKSVQGSVPLYLNANDEVQFYIWSWNDTLIVGASSFTARLTELLPPSAGYQGSMGYTGSAGTGSGSGYGDSNVVTLLANFGSNTITTTGNITAKTAGVDIGYKSIPQVSWTGNATLALSDSGKHYYTTSAGVITLTIPSNANVAFAIGDTVNFINQTNNTMQINLQAGVTMYQAGNNVSAARSLAGFGMATVTKVATDTWFIAGVGVY